MQHIMEMQHIGHGEGLEIGGPGDLVHRVSIPSELALVAVAEAARLGSS